MVKWIVGSLYGVILLIYAVSLLYWVLVTGRIGIEEAAVGIGLLLLGQSILFFQEFFNE
jgi:hypothetical protein